MGTDKEAHLIFPVKNRECRTIAMDFISAIRAIRD
jgi:hypothetical protein